MKLKLPRGLSVVAVLLAGGLTLAVCWLPWVSSSAQNALGADIDVQSTGANAAAIVPSAALIALVSGLILALAGKVARVIAAVAVALAGVLGLFGTISFLQDPNQALYRQAAQVAGVPELSGTVTISPWPVLALVLSAILVVIGATLPFAMGAWGRVGRRWESEDADTEAIADTGKKRTKREGARQHISDWDALTRGEDPSEEEDR